MTREFVLNDDSLACGQARVRDVAAMIVESVRGMSSIVAAHAGVAALRTSRPIHELAATDRGETLWDALALLLSERRHVDETRFFMRVAQKCPVSNGLGPEIHNRFLGCEALYPPGGDCLVLCAISGAISLSLASSQQWATSLLSVRFRELVGDDHILECDELVDNVSCAVHGTEIVDRQRARQIRGLTARTFWERRFEAFPQLIFGVGVEHQLQLIDEGTFSLVTRRFEELNETTRQWRMTGAPFPVWATHISSESASVENNPALLNSRTFRDEQGRPTICLWHARFGSGGRLHFSIREQERELVVGYVGPHLPLR